MHMSKLQTGQTVKGRYYAYTILDHPTDDLYKARLKVRSDLGEVDLGFAVELTSRKYDESRMIESFSFQGCTYYVYTKVPTAFGNDTSSSWVIIGQQKYRGELRGNVPHGRGEMKWQDCTTYVGDWVNGAASGNGVMTWPSGKRYEGQWSDGSQEGHGMMFYPNGSIYEGEFHNGQRHGHGILRQPNGEYLEGLFQNDKMSEQMTFVDSHGAKHEHTEIHKLTEPSLLAKIWDKTWRLWASIACFGLAVLCAGWVMDFFSGNGPSHMRVKGILAPIALVIYGCMLFAQFLGHIFEKSSIY